ncbi:topology modulation protein [Bacillaceae bacterium S4-13-58]
MKRILVLGVSAGVGKSTFAQKLGEKLHIQVYHLDTLYWKPGWIEASLEEFSFKQEQIVVNDSWIIEGNYSSTYDLRIQNTDTIIYLELPLSVCLYRVIKRSIQYQGKTRPDMTVGCKEKIDYKFLKFILTTYHSRKEKMEKRFEAFQKMNPENKVIKLKSKKGIEDYLESLQ